MQASQELSRQYATAIFDLALQGWIETLSKVETSLDETTIKAIQSKESFQEKQQELDKLLPKGISQPQKNFLYQLLKESQLGLLDQVLTDITRLARGGPQVQIAYITTAMPLDDKQKESFRQKLTAQYGDNLEFDFAVDPGLIGGAVVQVGDEIIDGSVKSRMAAISNKLGVRP